MNIAKIIASFVIAAASATAHADQWTGPDKDKHALAGLAISAAFSAASDSPAMGIAAGCAAGIAKELYDRRTPGHTVSARDAVVTCAGAAIGAYAPNFLMTRNGIAFRMTF